jgi:DNA-binding response OmpR family regulator
MDSQCGEPILIVEDDAKIRKLLAMVLAAEGRASVAVGSAGEALSRLNERKWGLILLDLLMPQPDGLEFLRTVRETCDGTPVLIVTGADDHLLLDSAVALGAQDILRKPFTLEELHQKVERYLHPGERQGLGPALAPAYGRKESHALLATTHSLKNQLAIAFGQVEFLLTGEAAGDPKLQRETLESIRQVLLESRELIRRLEGPFERL